MVSFLKVAQAGWKGEERNLVGCKGKELEKQGAVRRAVADPQNGSRSLSKQDKIPYLPQQLVSS